MGCASCGVPGTAQAQARGRDERDCEAGSDKSAHIGVGPFPFGRQTRREPLRSSLRIRVLHAVHREDERSEVTSSG
jgi:hypothetical protein